MTAPLDIPAIRRRAEAATKGPWEATEDGCIATMDDVQNRSIEQDAANARFIAAAREDIPALCDEVERLRSLCGDLSEAVALVDEGWLVRNTSADHEPGWIVNVSKNVLRLAKAVRALDSLRAAAEGKP